MSLKIRFPLKIKLITLMICLLLLSLSFYVYFAQDLFKKDKSAYVFENGLMTAQSLKTQTEYTFNSFLQKILLLSSLNHEDAQRLFTEDALLLSLGLYKNNGERIFYFQKENIKPLNFVAAPLLALRFDEEGNPFLLWQIEQQGGETWLVAQISFTPLLSIMNDFSLYETYLISEQGDLLAHKNSDLLNANQALPFKQEQRVQELIKSPLAQGVREYQGKMLAFYRIDSLHLYAVAEMPTEKAFSAANYLLNKSFSFAIIIMTIAVIAGILFARGLTRNLSKLYEAMQEVIKGNFKQEVKVAIKSNDEMGVLAKSFNYMSSEIIRYMQEMKEKARMENEFKVAQLVQNAFFPEKSLYLKQADVSIASYYTPATECGGDWWGYLEQDEKAILFIADATGHGVPAALLTATINCCKSNLQTIAHLNPELLALPSNILHFMNQAVCSVGGEIMLTCFVAIIDKKTQTITYANASHNPPFLLVSGEAKPLLAANGPRLGEKKESVYSENTVPMSDQDILILYTDGVLEAENNEGRQYGQRRMIKFLKEQLTKTTHLSALSSALVNDCFRHCGGEQRAKKDDFTLVLARAHADDPFFISSASDEENICHYLSYSDLNHLIGANAPAQALEQEKKQQTPSMSFLKNAPLVIINKESDYQAILEEELRKLDYSAFFDSPLDYFKLIGNELLSNALFKGESLTASADLQIMQTADFIAIAVSDHRGTLTRDQVIKSIKRGFEEKTPEEKIGGAGLGLYLVFAHCNQLIVENWPTERCTVTAIIELNKRFKKYKERISSFHYFEHEKIIKG